MAEYFSIPSREAAERFSKASLDAQRSYYDSLEDRKQELFAAVRLIKEHCASVAEEACRDCPLQSVCNRCFIGIPDEWPDPEEGGDRQ